jgi:TolA-binding protein
VDQYRTFPKLAETRYGVAFAVQQQGELDSALEIYEQVTQQTETETAAKARFMIGEIEFGRKKFENAIEHFLLVTVGYPYESWQALARLETARCFVELGDKERAVRTLREMIEKHPQHTRAIDAKKMLEDLTK